MQSINFNTNNNYWLGINFNKYSAIDINNFSIFESDNNKFSIIADNSIDLLTLHTFVSSTNLDYYYYAVESINEAKNILNLNNSDIIVFSLIDNKSATLLRFIKYMKKRPFIFIGGPKTKSIAIKAMKIGAFDCLIKDEYGKYAKHLSQTIQNILANNYKSIQKSVFDLGPYMELIKSTKALVYNLESLGPNFILKSPSMQLDDNEIQKIGMFFYITVGQGLNYNIGLFQLPVPYIVNLLALVYSFKVTDTKIMDIGQKKENYCLLALLFPCKNRFYMHHLTIIEQIIRYQLKNCFELNDLYHFSNILPIIPQIYDLTKFIG